MTIVGIFSDIHGNLPALEAVYADAISKGATRFLNAGDSVGYGPFPNEVIEFLKRKNVVSVVGDYDRKVLKFKHKKEKWRENKHPLIFKSFQWTDNHLSQKNRSALESFPIQIEGAVGEYSILLTHGSPFNIKDYISVNTDKKLLDDISKTICNDILITGNTHNFSHFVYNNKHFINPGSVGRQDDGSSLASYGLLSIINQKEITFQSHRINYDLSKLLSVIKKNGLPKEYTEMFTRGVSIKQILSEKKNTR